jgi:hypothetical protein
MSESIEELEKQAADLKKRISALREKGDPYVEKIMAELEQPGTYLEDRDSFMRRFIIRPMLKYRKVTKRSVEFYGQSLFGGKDHYPRFEYWSSGGYDLNMFHRKMEFKDYIIHHEPRAIIDYMGKLVKSAQARIETIRYLVNSVASTPDAYDEPKPVWSADEFKKATAKQLLPYVLDNFDKLVFYRSIETNYNNSHDVLYYVFRVIDTGDGAVLLKCVKISTDMRFREDWLPLVEENYMVRLVRYQPMPSSFDDDVKQMLSEIKSITSECHVVKPSKLTEMVSELDERFAKISKKFTDTVKESVNYTK